MADEVWASTDRYPEVEVSSLGRVRKKDDLSEVSTCKKDDGYVYVSVREDNKWKRVLLHRLVMLAHVQPPKVDAKLVVNHKNKDRADNRLANLEWLTHSANMHHGSKRWPIEQWSADNTQHIATYGSQPLAARALGVHDGSIRTAVQRGRLGKTSLGYFWRSTRPEMKPAPTVPEGATFKPIPGFEERYDISDKGGCVRYRPTGRILRPQPLGGYLGVCMATEDWKKTATIHRLVASTFLPGGSPELVVNHKDGNKFNNDADNLEWVSPSENCVHAVQTGLKKTQPVIMTLFGCTLRQFTSASLAAAWCGATPNNISASCSSLGRIRCRGFFWYRLYDLPADMLNCEYLTDEELRKLVELWEETHEGVGFKRKRTLFECGEGKSVHP
jgi:hypothetical protein